LGEESTTECLYYRAYMSYLLQDPDFRMNFEMLFDQFKKYPESFKIFEKIEVQRMAQMQEAFKTGIFNLFKGSTEDFSKVILPKIENVEQKHRDLVLGIYQDREKSLVPYIGQIDEACPEYPVVFGNIDLMILSGRCAHAIEFKTDTATHAIIGQVMKYYVGLSLLFNLKFFNDVKLYTICPGYDQAAYNGLRQLGVTMLLVSPQTLKVSMAP